MVAGAMIASQPQVAALVPAAPSTEHVARVRLAVVRILTLLAVALVASWARSAREPCVANDKDRLDMHF